MSDSIPKHINRALNHAQQSLDPIVLRQAYLPSLDQTLDVEIAQGRIHALAPSLPLDQGRTGVHEIDARGKWLLPGIVDLSARLCASGTPSSQSIAQELHAAVSAGVTRLVTSPDTRPVLDEAGLVEMLIERINSCQSAQVHPLGALTRGLAGQELSELSNLHRAGCIGFTQALTPISNVENLRRAMLYARSFNYTLWLYPQDAQLGANAVAHQSAFSSRMGLVEHPSIAETIAVQVILELIRATKARVHFCRLSTARSVALIRAAKAEGLAISADVSISHLCLNEFDLGYFNTAAKLNPPLRGADDQAALSAGVIDGTIDAICSDHTPVLNDQKRLPFAQAHAGASTLELLLPLTLAWAQRHQVAPSVALSKISTNPTAIIALNPNASSTGPLTAPAPNVESMLGSSADMSLFDPAPSWRVLGKALRSRGQQTPFEGQLLQGQVTQTWIAGRLVFER